MLKFINMFAKVSVIIVVWVCSVVNMWFISKYITNAEHLSVIIGVILAMISVDATKTIWNSK